MPSKPSIPQTCVHCRQSFLARKDDVLRGYGKYCSRHCYHQSSRGRQPMGSASKRFWSKVNKDGDCWEWTASTSGKGYGQFSIGSGRLIMAHRMAWILSHGPIPDGVYVCHHCDNPCCVNPEHLFLGTPKDNVDDMDRKGRRVSDKVPKGEVHPNSKLTRDDVRSIRDDPRPYRAIAKSFGISKGHVAAIKGRTAWKHVK